MKFKFLIAALTAIVGGYILGGVLLADDRPLTNGDFEDGTLSSWTTFLTANGTQLAGPAVIMFDLNGNGFNSNVARFQLGSTDGAYGGGGLYQTVHLAPGTYTVSADIGVNDTGSVGGVYTPGLFELLVDGIVASTYKFNAVKPSQTLVASLAVGADNPYEIRLRITRPYPPSSKLIQLIDNVAVRLASSAPLTVQSSPVGGAANCDTVGELKDEVLSLGLPNGKEKSLVGKLDATQAAIDAGDNMLAVKRLNKFIARASSLAPKHISQADSDSLVGCARVIIDAI